MNIDEVTEHYKTSPTFKLQRLAQNPDGLPLELVPILQKELLSRGEQEDALRLTEYLINSSKEDKVLSKEELRQEVDDRLKKGESLESIALKFKENGVDLFEQVEEEGKLQESVFDYILSLNEQGVPDEAIQEKLKENFSMSEAEVEIIKAKLRRKGRNNLVVGYSLIVVIGLLMILALAAGGSAGIGGVLLMALGVWRVYEGHRILSNSNSDAS
jgi:hypothetical protein